MVTKKSSLMLFLFFIILIEQNIFSQSNDFPINMYVTSEEGLNVREAPSLNSNRITTLMFGEQISILERGPREKIGSITDYWFRVFYGGSSDNYGWVFGGYLSKEAPLYIIEKIVYNMEELTESINFTSVNDYLGKWILLDNEGKFHSSDSYFIVYVENGVYKFLIKYYNDLKIGIVSLTEYNGIVMDQNNRNRNLIYTPWSTVGKPLRTLNTHVVLIDKEGPLGYFQRIVK